MNTQHMAVAMLGMLALIIAACAVGSFFMVTLRNGPGYQSR